MTTTFPKTTTKSLRVSPKTSMTETRLKLLRPYAPDLAGNVRHDHILNVGARVQAKLISNHQHEIATAVAAALTHERTLAADRLVTHLAKEERKTQARIKVAVVIATENHTAAVVALHEQRDVTEMLAIQTTIDDCAQKQQQALHHARAAADHRLTYELHLNTVETTNVVTNTLTTQFEEMSSQARAQADERHQIALAYQATISRVKFDNELTALRLTHQADVDKMHNTLDSTGTTTQALEQQIQSLLSELETTQTTLANTLADYRRTLAYCLPNYNENTSFLL